MKTGNSGGRKGNIFWQQQGTWLALAMCGDSPTCAIKMEEVSWNNISHDCTTDENHS